MDEKFNINIKIGDREYPVSINRNDSKKEEIVRKATQRINESIEFYRSKGYKHKDEQDFMAMTLLAYTVKLMELESRDNLAPIINDIKKLNFVLEEVLNKE